VSVRAALPLLLLAALLEVGGDALVRAGLLGAAGAARFALVAAGGAVLTLYGISVNLPEWNFGRSLGVYVVLFFLLAQLVNLLAFGLLPSPAILLGGALILAGGLTIALWQG
jgi:hypothetical protein